MYNQRICACSTSQKRMEEGHVLNILCCSFYFRIACQFAPSITKTVSEKIQSSIQCLILCIYVCTVKTVKNIFISLHVYLYAHLCICMLKNVLLLCLVDHAMYSHRYLCIYFIINHEFNIELHVYT